jgi:hypothetical protein
MSWDELDCREMDGDRENDVEYYGGKQCKHCGKAGLHWMQTQVGWRLADDENSIHSCRSK